MWHQRGGAKRFAQHFGKVKARMRFVDHHLAHAISAYAYSGFADSAVVVMDGRGALGGYFHLARPRWPARSHFDHSVSRFRRIFLTVSSPHYLGFQRNSDEWKVMGLAPYASLAWI